MKNNVPFVKLFRTSQAHYLYDVNTNDVLEISLGTFEILKNILKNNLEISSHNANGEIYNMLESGYLKSNRVVISQHPMNNILFDLIENNCSSLILQVTQKCNLRCEYCVYSGEYADREHSQKEMSFEVAKKGIDYIINHSFYSDFLSVSFYGGEPLLNFELIKKCVNYINSLNISKPIIFSLTTNGTLLNNEINEFLRKNDVAILFSLDGPRELHNKHRKYAFSQKGSYGDIYSNVMNLKCLYPDYYEKYVQFNCVVDFQNDFTSIDDFFKYDELTKQSEVMYSPIKTEFNSKIINNSEEYQSQFSYELFKIFLSKFNVVNEHNLSHFHATFFSNLQKFSKKIGRTMKLENSSHHSGPCVPGVTRLFLNADGLFFPCERVNELSQFACIGNVNDGIDCNKVSKLLNIEKYSSENCRNCFAYRNCKACIKDYDGVDSYSEEMLMYNCNKIKEDFLNMLKDYVTLKDLGYDFIPELLGEENKVNI